MNTPNEQAFKKVIDSLAHMQTVQPSSAFRHRMEKKVKTLTAPRRLFVPKYAFNAALALVVLLLIGGTSVIASAESKPGTLFYPVKKMVETVQTSFIPAISVISTDPTPIPHQKQSKPIPTLTPVPQTYPNDKQLLHVDETDTETASEPTQTPSPTPTPTPSDQSIVPDVEKPVDQVTNNNPVQIGLPIGGVEITQPTPTPPPPAGGSDIEGSKDNGSNAGAGGSLLPKLKKSLKK